MSIQSIKWNNGKLKILDNLLIPKESKYIEINNTADGWKAIRTMQVRGAPGIAIAGSLSLATEILNSDIEVSSKNDVKSFVIEKMNYLVTARPTAVNMKNARDELIKLVTEWCSSAVTLEDLKEKIVQWCTNLLAQDVSTNKAIGKFGGEDLIKRLDKKSKFIVLTHCNTGSLATAGYGTALGVIRYLFSEEKLERVFATETRPYNQGARLTSYELVQENIPATLICDSMVAAFMKTRGCDAIFVGADRIASNGDTANKIGTYQIAVLAKHHNIPLYVCVSLTTIDFGIENGSSIVIEERPPSELTSIAGIQIAAPGIHCWNPAFDVTPAELITGGIVTEKGVFAPTDLDQLKNC